MTDIDQAREVERFRKAIYPLWAPIFNRAAKDPAMSEIRALHLADEKIYDWLEANEQHKPMRQEQAPARAKAQATYSRALGAQ